MTTSPTITDRPAGPFVVIGNCGFVRVCESDTDVSRASLYSLCRGFFQGLHAYDRAGLKWGISNVQAPHKVNALTRILAHTIYNPKFNVTLTWQNRGHYELVDLQQALEGAVERDDDVLTQFVSADRLKRIVRASKTYEQLVGAMRKHGVA